MKPSELLDAIAAAVVDVKAKEEARDQASSAFTVAAAAHKDAAVKLSALQADLNELLGGMVGAVETRVRMG
jgi:hypothetical protein